MSSNGRTAVVLFTRDLRVHDQPALSEAARTATQVVPLFVLDPALLHAGRAANRVVFLVGALADLRRSLRGLGADLVVHEPWRSPIARAAPEYPERLEARHATA